MGPIHPVWGHLVIFVWAGGPDLASMLSRTDFDVDNLDFFVFFWIPNFQISRSQISKFPEIWLGPVLGRAWALGRAEPRKGWE